MDSEVLEIVRSLEKSNKLIAETLSKNVNSIVTLDERMRRLETNVSVIADHTAKNAPNIQNLPWESTNHSRAIELSNSIIDKQNSATAKSQEMINKWILASFKGSEQVQASLNAIIAANERSSHSMELLARSIERLLQVFEEIGEFQTKTKATLEYLVDVVSSESSVKKTNRNIKMAEADNTL